MLTYSIYTQGLWVLLDAHYVQTECHLQLWMSHVRFLEPEQTAVSEVPHLGKLPVLKAAGRMYLSNFGGFRVKFSAGWHMTAAT